jgi:hypothetical protein
MTKVTWQRLSFVVILFFTLDDRDIRKLVKLGLLALSFGKIRVEKNGGASKYRTQGQTLECTKTQVEQFGHEIWF